MSALILIVDDHPTNLKLVSEVLQAAGYEVLRAVDADQALAVLQQSLPDLILMDIALPGMNGLELTRKLKEDAATRQIRIVALTAFAMKGDDQKARDAGCDGYIAKPVNTRRLPLQVAEFLQRNP
ncbi:MAG TPA: response regulator [Thermoanaerobaculia bacterium]|nr:response regulator [Thermoanaerobaculia bacterium]